MTKKCYKTIDDILDDPEVIELLKTFDKKINKTYTDPDIESLKRIEEWVNKNKKYPTDTKEDIEEREMFYRLKGLKKKCEKLKDYDNLNLLRCNNNDSIDKLKEEIKSGEKKLTLDEILNDEIGLLDDYTDDNDISSKLFNTDFYRRKTSELPKTKAKRMRINDFDKYSVMFKNVQRELSYGQRTLVPFKNYEILLHHFYVLKNQLIYIESFGDEEEKNNENGKYFDRRVHVIYENGTESDVLRRGLGSSLYGRGGKIVTDATDEIKLNPGDYQTGYIYVLMSSSKDPRITSIKPLYKVGFTRGSVKKRIANAENEPTYLYAPVKEIQKFPVINIKAETLETAIHHALQNYKVDMDIRLSNGKIVSPREWFHVDLDTIGNIISEIISRLQMEQ